MNTIFNGSISRQQVTYDYSGIWTRRPDGTLHWKAVVMNSDVVCRPSGAIDAELTEAEVREVIRELVKSSVDDALVTAPVRQ